MSKPTHQAAPLRSQRHDALAAFVGDWTAVGQSFGASCQRKEAPRAKSTPCTSTHSARWHTGEFFLVQDERATIDGPFDTLSIMGWDEQARTYFARSFENHGYYRHYGMAVDGRVWTITGESERARIEFSADGATQTITWEWQPEEHCDRVATRL